MVVTGAESAPTRVTLTELDGWAEATPSTSAMGSVREASILFVGARTAESPLPARSPVT